MFKQLIIILLVIATLSSCSYKRFSGNETKLIFAGDTSQPLYVTQIFVPEDSLILRAESKKIKPDSTNKKLNYLIKRMYKTVRDTNNPGVGLAAPQVGINKRIIWVQRFDKQNSPFEVYLNAEIIKYYSYKTSYKEGCLSVKGYRGIVERPDSVTINYDLLDGTNHTETLNGFTSRIFQHEIDHLDGKIYFDRIDDKDKIEKTK